MKPGQPPSPPDGVLPVKGIAGIRTLWYFQDKYHSLSGAES
jgi:hypothetical protein